MKNFLLCLLLVSVSCSKANTSSLDIINGTNAERSDMQQSMVQIKGSSMNCSGVMVSKNLILTAAHCVLAGYEERYFTHESGYRVSQRLGGSHVSLGRVSKIYIPEDYIELYESLGYRYPSSLRQDGQIIYGGGLYDFAFLKIDKVEGAVPLPIISESDAIPEVGDEVSFYGFGSDRRSYSLDLCQLDDIQDLPRDPELQLYRTLQEGHNVVHQYLSHQRLVEDNLSHHFQFIILTACNRVAGENSIPGGGDSGGPLLMDGKIAGIASLGGNDMASYIGLKSPYFQTYMKDVFEQNRSFLDYCTAPQDTELNHTIEVLKKLLHTDSCELVQKKLSKRVRIDLAFKGLQNLKPLSQFTQIEELNLRGNNISDISPLMGLNKLRFLNLSQNKISDLAPLKNMGPEFVNLNLRDNQITDLSSLSFLRSLEVLNLSQNRIENVKNLAYLRSMKSILLDGNPLGTEIAVGNENCPLGDNPSNKILVSWCTERQPL